MRITQSKKHSACSSLPTRVEHPWPPPLLAVPSSHPLRPPPLPLTPNSTSDSLGRAPHGPPFSSTPPIRPPCCAAASNRSDPTSCCTAATASFHLDLAPHLSSPPTQMPTPSTTPPRSLFQTPAELHLFLNLHSMAGPVSPLQPSYSSPSSSATSSHCRRFHLGSKHHATSSHCRHLFEHLEPP